MRQLLRPFFIIVVASFLLGIWYALSPQEASKEPTTQATDDPLIILARYPQLWQDLLHPLIEGKRLPIEIRGSALNQYPETLRSCDLVETRSDFIQALVEQKLIQSLPKDYASILAMVHPDFFPPELEQKESHFFPLFWASYAWMRPNSDPEKTWDQIWLELTRQQGSILLLGDYESLLSPLLKHGLWPESEMESEVEDRVGDEMLQLNQWIDSWISQVEWMFGQPTSAIPPSNKRVLQILSHVQYRQLPQDQILSDQELVVWGLSPCLKTSEHPALRELLNYLARGEEQLPILKKYGLASALNSSLHWRDEDRQHSAVALRDLSYSKISWRRVNWDHLVMWDQILRSRISSATEQ